MRGVIRLGEPIRTAAKLLLPLERCLTVKK